MKYSFQILKKFISVNDSVENISKNLILKTVEIENIEKREIDKLIVIGLVNKCQKHPDADKLNVCEVDCGDKGTYQIICGGENVREGIFVPVALPGTFFQKEGIKIEKRKMRGIESNGMICSKQEIGINEDLDKHNIRNIKEDLEDVNKSDLGKCLNEKYPRLESQIIQVDNKGLTNRPDLTGHFGIACELNAIYNLDKRQNIKDKKKEEKIGGIIFNKIVDYYKQFKDTNIFEILDNSKKLDRNVVSKTDSLNSYILIEIKNIKINQSGFFTRLQTLDLGSNPINNRVDFSNLFMVTSGQPIHFFDADKVDGDIIARNAKDGEIFVDLFETKHILKSNDIVIADKNKILALAGIVGGLESGVNENTKNILVEIANFDPVAVRKTGTRLALRTDAELRFEKNINPLFSLYCLILFLDELKYYKKDLGEFDMGGISYYLSNKLKTMKTKEIEVDFEKMSEFIFGNKIEGFKDDAIKILQGLGFEIKKKYCSAPIRRGPNDINIVQDIYEEVGRIYGYEKIENIPLMSGMKNVEYIPYVKLNRKIEEILVRNLNCDHTETYPWIGEKTLNIFGVEKNNLYTIQNPINPELVYLRNCMSYGLLSHTSKNSKFFDRFKIFDIGKVWEKIENKSDGKKFNKPSLSGSRSDGKFADEFVGEEGEMGLMIYQKEIKNRNDDPIIEGKQMIKIICKELGLSGKINFKKTDKKSYHPKKQADIIYEGNKIGFLGSIHPIILKDFKLTENAGLVYVSLQMNQILDVLKNQKNIVYTYESLQDQIIYRDLCFVIDENKTFDIVLDSINEIKDIIKSVEVFDLYEGKNLGEGKKSISLKIKITGDGTLTTEMINEVMKKCIQKAEGVGGKLRE